MSLHDFTPVSILNANTSVSCTIGINFNDSTQPASFDINFTVNDDQIYRNINIKAPIGEIIRSILITEEKFSFEKEKLKGMNEYSTKIDYSGNRKSLSQQILEAANVAVISSDDNTIRYSIYKHFY
jgi:AP-3 complex subunit beta